MSDLQDDIEKQAEEAKDSSADQHLGDAMDDAEDDAAKATGDDELEAEGKRSRPEADAPGPVDDVNLEPPSS